MKFKLIKGSRKGKDVYGHVRGLYGGNGIVKQKLDDEQLKEAGFRDVPITSRNYAHFVASRLKGVVIDFPQITAKNSKEKRLERKKRRRRGAFMKVTMKGIKIHGGAKVMNKLWKELPGLPYMKSVKSVKYDQLIFEVNTRAEDVKPNTETLDAILDLELGEKGKKTIEIVEKKYDVDVSDSE